MTEWQKVKLGDICDVRDGTHDSPKQSLEGKFLVTSKHIKGGKIDLSSAYKISLEDFNFVNQRSKVEQWDILISMIGTVGEICLICTPPDFAIKNVGLIKAGNKDLAQYLFYYLKSPISQNDIETRLKGTTQQYLSLSEIRDFPVFLPPLEIQRKIAGILGALDDRIDVLRRENVVLEQMAQAVFQSWFVDFDIVRAKAAGTPESEVCEKYHITPELYALFPSALTPDNLPLGWEKKTLEDMGMIVGGGTPSTENEKFFALAGTAVPWITPKDLSGYADKYISHGSIDISQEGLKHSSAKLMPQGTVLFSSRAPIGYCVIAEKPVSTNQGFKSITPNKREYIEYLYQFLKSNVSMISRYASGSTFKEVSGSVMKQIPILMPPEKLLFSFENMCFCFNAKNKNNSKQIRVLSATRDALLPKLMNGEIEV